MSLGGYCRPREVCNWTQAGRHVRAPSLPYQKFSPYYPAVSLPWRQPLALLPSWQEYQKSGLDAWMGPPIKIFIGHRARQVSIASRLYWPTKP